MNSQGAALVQSANIVQRKNVNIEEVENGYVVRIGYNHTKIAATKEDLLAFISEYIDSK